MASNQQSEIQNPNSIILCPGQGAQQVGMGKAWHEASDVARKTFAEADALLEFDLTKVCFEGPVDQLDRTDVAQAAIYVTSVACYRALLDRGELTDENIAATAGLSLGEFTALHIAGAFSFEDGLRLVRLRGQAMQDAAEAVPSSMVALIRADEAQANAVCDAARGDDVLAPANFNAPGQVVISGAKAACERAVNIAGDHGVMAKELAVAGAFHSPIMQPAADRLGEALEQVDWQSPRVPVAANVTGQMHDADPATIRRRLVEQLTHPVRWADDVSHLIAHVDGQFVELAPNKVLAGLMKRIDRQTAVVNFDTPA